MSKDMDQSKSIKIHLLKMIEDLMMGNSADKFKPVKAEVVVAGPDEDEDEDTPEKSTGSLAEHLAEASEDAPDDMMDAEDCETDDEEEDDEKAPKIRSLRDFLGRK